MIGLRGRFITVVNVNTAPASVALKQPGQSTPRPSVISGKPFSGMVFRLEGGRSLKTLTGIPSSRGWGEILTGSDRR